MSVHIKDCLKNFTYELKITNEHRRSIFMTTITTITIIIIFIVIIIIIFIFFVTTIIIKVSVFINNSVTAAINISVTSLAAF